MTATRLQKGKVKWFSVDKGYGFIRPENGSEDVFIHATALQKSGISTLEDDTAVEFELGQSKGKTCAVFIRKAA